jgi:hypothetical protein
MAGFASPAPSTPVVEMAGSANSKTVNTVQRSLDRSQARGRSAAGTSLCHVNCKSLLADFCRLADLQTHFEDVRHAPLVPHLRCPDELFWVPKSGWVE